MRLYRLRLFGLRLALSLFYPRSWYKEGTRVSRHYLLLRRLAHSHRQGMQHERTSTRSMDALSWEPKPEVRATVSLRLRLVQQAELLSLALPQPFALILHSMTSDPT